MRHFDVMLPDIKESADEALISDEDEGIYKLRRGLVELGRGKAEIKLALKLSRGIMVTSIRRQSSSSQRALLR